MVKLSAEEALAFFKAEVEKSALPQLSKDFPAVYAAARSKIATHEQVMPKPSLREVQVRDRVQKAVEGIRMGKGGQTASGVESTMEMPEQRLWAQTRRRISSLGSTCCRRSTKRL